MEWSPSMAILDFQSTIFLHYVSDSITVAMDSCMMQGCHSHEICILAKVNSILFCHLFDLGQLILLDVVDDDRDIFLLGGRYFYHIKILIYIMKISNQSNI